MSLAANGRTPTEARVRFPSEESAYQAEPERWSGIRTRDTMIKSHLLYPTELSCWYNRLESNQLPPGHPGALPLSYDRLFVQRNTKPQSGSRQPGSHEPGHM